MSPLQFVKRERIGHAQQLIRETSRSLMEVALEVGYTSRAISLESSGELLGCRPRSSAAACKEDNFFRKNAHDRARSLRITVRL
jgi:transcriptional regulator GlxA family with amidase domain